MKQKVNWSEIASSLDITNGHAARMRFHRFKQQMEGIPPKPQVRKPKSDAPRGKKKNDGAGNTQELSHSPDRQRGEEAAPYVEREIQRPEDSMAGIQQAMGSSVQVEIEPVGQPFNGRLGYRAFWTAKKRTFWQSMGV
ncbi:hypothetical protein G7Y79_00001g003710 [Physcia stellaris]|nr:hypothetical protein G7Y79_00001g003710 [Physcia stellaris]